MLASLRIELDLSCIVILIQPMRGGSSDLLIFEKNAAKKRDFCLFCKIWLQSGRRTALGWAEPITLSAPQL